MMNEEVLKTVGRNVVARLSLILVLMSTCGFTGESLATMEASAQTAANEAATRQADIEVFVREGCPHCVKAKEFLDALGHEHPELRIVLRDIQRDPSALGRLKEIAEAQGMGTVRTPAFDVRGHLIIGYSDESTTGKLILDALSKGWPSSRPSAEAAGSCGVQESPSCEAGAPVSAAQPETFEITLLGRRIALEQVGLPLFTVSLGLLDGFNPCSMWVLILMISLLAPMKNRMRMFAVAGTFVVVEGVAYLVFMAAWLNLFLLIGLSRASEIIIALIAMLAGTIHLKDFWAYGRGVSLSIPEAAKPGIYARARGILQAENLRGALIGAVVLAVLVQIVEFLCTSGFPALLENKGQPRSG